MRLTETVLSAEDETDLLVRCYQPAEGQAERTLLIVHGVCEHGDRYQHVVSRLVAHGWNVIVPDLRGHGRSGGVPVHVTSFRRYAEDLGLIYRHFELNSGNTAMLGHSMGGLVALRFAQIHAEHLSALVLMSPLLGVKVPIPRTTIAAGRMLSFVAPRTRFRSRVDPKYTTRCEVSLERRANDPLLHRSVTAGWYFAMKASLAAAWEETDRIRLPVLIMQAGADEIVDSQAPTEWVEQIPASDVAYHELSGHYHELLNEPDWLETADTVIEWLHTRIPGQSESKDQCIA